MIKELELLKNKDLPIDVQMVLQMLIEDIDEAGSRLSPYAFGLYNGERIPQLIASMVEGSKSLMFALQKAIQINFPNIKVSNKFVIKDLKKTIYINLEVTLIALADLAKILKKSNE